jgi:hypothetical protein
VIKQFIKILIYICKNKTINSKKPRLLKKSNSQAGQESFVCFYNDYKLDGTYVEIGSGDPISGNNTYLLETRYNYFGVGIDLDFELIGRYNSCRSNIGICEDATQINYSKLFETFKFPTQIDYLQIDIDPPSQSLKALQNILQTKFRFTTITFEHDLYKSTSNSTIVNESRELLKNANYNLIFSEVKYKNSAFEDWYIDNNYLDLRKFDDFQCNNLEYWKNFNLFMRIR